MKFLAQPKHRHYPERPSLRSEVKNHPIVQSCFIPHHCNDLQMETSVNGGLVIPLHCHWQYGEMVIKNGLFWPPLASDMALVMWRDKWFHFCPLQNLAGGQDDETFKRSGQCVTRRHFKCVDLFLNCNQCNISCRQNEESFGGKYLSSG